MTATLNIIRRKMRTRVTPRTRRAVLDAAGALASFGKATQARVIHLEHELASRMAAEKDGRETGTE